VKIITYASTVGLDRISVQERYRTWRNIHDTLMVDDKNYRRRVTGYLRQIVVASAIYCAGLGAPVFVIGLTPKSEFAMASLWGAMTLGFLAFVLYQSFRLQAYENARIAKELLKRE
jgi:hypothetical protein